MSQVPGSGRNPWRRVMGAALLSSALLLTPVAVQAQETPDPAVLHLVTLDTAGTATSSLGSDELVAMQHDVLSAVSGPAPLYRWTTALNGFAARLNEAQVDQLRADPRVAMVEENSVRQLASASTAPQQGRFAGRTKGGAGVVIGVVDSGIWPESPLFADTPGLGRTPTRFAGFCEEGAAWGAGACHRKLVGARWFVEGFGTERLASTESLSPRDHVGHGTQVASVAAGNGGVSVAAGSDTSGVFSGTAPQARLAIYKACWSAPDPDDDGCATADLVTAIDRATADRVDVLNLSVTDRSEFDTVSHALLGAAEADVVVVAAAGNEGDRAYAGHTAPWITTVGALAKQARHGRLDVTDGPSLVGASRTDRGTHRARMVLAGRARASGVPLAQARQCRPGSLDAGAVQGKIVVCLRGGIGRIDKSEVVRRADGIGMILVNPAGSGTFADVHTVPTLHLGARAGSTLVRHLRRHPDATARLTPMTEDLVRLRTARWSASGNPAGPLVKPDLVAPATGVLTAIPPSADRRWSTLTGTSAASAHVAGLAAVVRGRHPGWKAATVRSAITTSAATVADGSSPLRQGSGRLRERAALSPGLAFRVGRDDYRSWLSGDLSSRDLNTPSILVGPSGGTITRRVTNVGVRAMYYSSRVTGFSDRQVRVEPAAIRLRPGGSARFRVIVEPDTSDVPRADHGVVTWLGAQGTTVNIPVVLAR